jgi:2-phosphosulfolactate phosphatase
MNAFTVRQASSLPGDERAATIVVIDVLRATSVIATALANGAARVIPVAGIAEAFAYKQQLGANVLLGGERNNVRIEGFDLGNSPAEYTRERVAGTTIVITTTNGTAAIELARTRAGRLYTAALINAGAVAQRLAAHGGDVVAVCAGTEGRFSLEDWVCAGALAGACEERGASLDDAALAAAELFRAHASNLYALLELGEHARHLAKAGFANDVRDCAALNRYDVAPLLDGDSLKTLL